MLRNDAAFCLLWILTAVIIIYVAVVIPVLLVAFVLGAILILKIPLPGNREDPISHMLSWAGIQELLKEHAEQEKYRKFLAGRQRKKDEEQRIQTEAQNEHNEIAAREQKKREMEQLNHLHLLWDTQFSEYLTEAEKFRVEYGKNVRCDVCGKWQGGLTLYGDKTFCEKCMPANTGQNNRVKYD